VTPRPAASLQQDTGAVPVVDENNNIADARCGAQSGTVPAWLPAGTRSPAGDVHVAATALRCRGWRRVWSDLRDDQDVVPKHRHSAPVYQ
jgi:hypothetical protein